MTDTSRGIGLIVSVALISGIAASVAAPSVARAGLLGDTVDLVRYYPNLSTVFIDDGTAAVNDTVEYSNQYENIEITNTKIIITELTGPSDSYLSADFNGYVLGVITGEPITGVSVDPSSTESVDALSFNASDIFINMQDVQIPFVGAEAIIDVTTATAVPEPTSLALLGGALGLFVLLPRAIQRYHQALPRPEMA
jgi:hypothetical protein